MATDGSAPTSDDAVPEPVRLVLISEGVAATPQDDYGAGPGSLFDTTTLAAFAAAGLVVGSVAELRRLGVHLTVVLRQPHPPGRVDAATVRAAVPALQEELATFPGARAYALMGDVAIAAVNQIARSRSGVRAVPAGATYRIRGGEFLLDGVRLFPSYLQAGPAWYIEASKRRMIAEDLAAALAVAGIGTPRTSPAG